MAILRGNLAPEGCVAKVAGHAEEVFRGTARVFDREEDAFVAGKAGRGKGGDVFEKLDEGAPGRPRMRETAHATGGNHGAWQGARGAGHDRGTLSRAHHGPK